ncbi:hypothetical protein M5K25_001943 [Dendrobium thyrsiflorum]|uniref:Uncharacterized protein n=1 Tax=Dendrobium thyrsiflorum TaxID=117978 RepID=A0ABD0VT24_DENTH
MDISFVGSENSRPGLCPLLMIFIGTDGVLTEVYSGVNFGRQMRYIVSWIHSIRCIVAARVEMGIWNWKVWAFENGKRIFKIGNCTILYLKRMVGGWMIDLIKIPWFRRPGSSWSLVYLVRGDSRPNLTEGSLSAAKGFDVIGEHTGASHNHNIVMPFGGESPGSEGPGS